VNHASRLRRFSAALNRPGASLVRPVVKKVTKPEFRKTLLLIYPIRSHSNLTLYIFRCSESGKLAISASSLALISITLPSAP